MGAGVSLRLSQDAQHGHRSTGSHRRHTEPSISEEKISLRRVSAPVSDASGQVRQRDTSFTNSSYERSQSLDIFEDSDMSQHSVGFRPEVMGQHPRPLSGQGSHPRRPQSARSAMEMGDRMFMRILTAEEFITRMDETDATIRYWSQCDELELKQAQIKDYLGLRGHLQDELLRIQAMMSEEDPNLTGLDDFEATYPAVVQRIKELHNKSQRIHIQSTDIGLDTDDINIQTAETDTPTLPSIGINQGVSQSVQTSARSNRNAVMQSSAQTSSGVGDINADDDEAIENQLKPKFRAEENHVVEDFTNRIVHSRGRLSQDDVDKLLSDHAISMQALRKKQEMEKEKYRQFLEAKKGERLLNRRAKRDNATTSPGASSTPRQGEFFFIDFNNSNQPKKSTPKRGPQGQKSTWFYVDMDGNTTYDDKNKSKEPSSIGSGNTSTIRNRNGVAKPVAIVAPVVEEPEPIDDDAIDAKSADKEHQNSNGVSASDSDDDDKENLEEIMQRLKGPEEGYEDDFEEEMSDEEVEDENMDREDLKTTLKDDLWSTLREKDGTSKETFQELLGAYRDQEDERSAIRTAEKVKHKSSFLSKLAEKQKKGKSGGSNDDDAETGSTTSSDDLESSAQSFEKELEEIRAVDSELVKKLLAKRRNMTDADFQDLLKKHLSDVERLRRQRAGERDKLDERLREKLKMKRNTNEEEKDEELERELSTLDEKLSEELKRRGKSLDECDLEELLEHYRRQQELLLNRRKSEKSRNDEKLRRKLEEKARRKKEYQDLKAGSSSEISGKDTDDSFFQEIQHLQAAGKLTEEQFSGLLNGYLSNVDKTKREKRREQLAKQREEGKEDDMNRVSTLFQESQEVSKQIKGMRERQKNMTDEKLLKKLQAKKNKKKTSTES